MGLKTIVKGAIVLVAVTLVLAVSCPDKESFDRWAKKTQASKSESGLQKAKGKALAAQADWTANYRDFILWATVEAYQGGKQHRYLGVLWIWIDLGEM